MKYVAEFLVVMAFFVFGMIVMGIPWREQHDAYRALRDSLATAQADGAVGENAARGGEAPGVLRPHRGRSVAARGNPYPGSGRTIILLYRESDSTLRVARLRAEGR